MIDKDFSSLFKDIVKKPVKRDVFLSNYSSFQIGGKADYYFEAETVFELKNAISIANKCSLPFYIIGGGYNLLFDDDGFRGFIIRNKVQGIKLIGKSDIEVLSGTSLSQVIQFVQKSGLSGIEFLVGIPGTIGGAVFGNAGAFNQSIGDLLKEAYVLDETGEETRVHKDYFEFKYRQSSLRRNHDILLRAVLSCQYGGSKQMKKALEKNLKTRKMKHPPENTACAGSYFKNQVKPDDSKVAAGELLEQIGAKGLRVGGAAVYSGHANFIINLGGARAKDILELAKILKDRVKEKTGFELIEEVIFLPATPSSS